MSAHPFRRDKPVSDLIRQVRAAETRDPVDAALSAIACLSVDQHGVLQSRFNATFDKLGLTMVFVQREAAE